MWHAVVFDQIGRTSIRMLTAGVDAADVPLRAITTRRIKVSTLFPSLSADVGRLGGNEFSRTQEVYQALERHASLCAAGLYLVGTRRFSSSYQFRTTTIRACECSPAVSSPGFMIRKRSSGPMSHCRLIRMADW
jgi:hypothetical protein